MPDDDEVRRVPALLCITVVAMLPAASARTEPVPETSCAVLPADDAWHLQVGGLPLHPRNDDRRRTSHARRSLVHPGFGPPSYGIPFDVVGAAHDDVSIDVRYEDESDPDPYPFGPDIQVEGGSDRHALMIDRSDCTLYELFAVRWNEGNPTAGSGAVFALEGSRANELRPAGWTSADVAGLAIFPGLLRFDEIEAGVIDHAIRMTVGCTADRYLGRPGTRPTPAPRIARRWARGSGCGEASTCPIRRTSARGPAGLQDLRSDRRGRRQRLVRPGNDRRSLDERPARPAERIPATAFVAVDARACQIEEDSAAFA